MTSSAFVDSNKEAIPQFVSLANMNITLVSRIYSVLDQAL